MENVRMINEDEINEVVGGGSTYRIAQNPQENNIAGIITDYIKNPIICRPNR